MTARLLLVSSLNLYLLADSLLISYLGNCQVDLNTELGLELCSRYLDVLLAETAEYLLLCSLVLNICESGILLNKSLDTCRYLSLIALSLSLYSH